MDGEQQLSTEVCFILHSLGYPCIVMSISLIATKLQKKVNSDMLDRKYVTEKFLLHMEKSKTHYN